MLIDWNHSVLHSNITPKLYLVQSDLMAMCCVYPIFWSDVPHAYLKNKMKKYQHNKEFKIWHYQILLRCPDYNVTKTQNRRC